MALPSASFVHAYRRLRPEGNKDSCGFDRFRSRFDCLDLLQRGIARKFTLVNGRGERIRTSGPCLPKTVLYQAELLPDRNPRMRSMIAAGAKARAT